MARGWHYTKLSLFLACALFVLCAIVPFPFRHFFVLVLFLFCFSFSFVSFSCSRWSFFVHYFVQYTVDVSLIVSFLVHQQTTYRIGNDVHYWALVWLIVFIVLRPDRLNNVKNTMTRLSYIITTITTPCFFSYIFFVW